MAITGPLLTRQRVMKVILEATPGSKLAGTQALTVFDPVINPSAPFEERNDVGLYRGPSTPGVVGERSGKCTFAAEMRGGAAGTLEPGLAILLQACGFKQTVQVYNTHSTPSNDKCISLDIWQAGRKKGLAGAAGEVTFGGDIGKRMMCTFDLSGIWEPPVDEALPAFAPSVTPPIFIQSGTFTWHEKAFKIGSFELKMGNVVVERKSVAGVGGIAHYLITYQVPLLTVTPEAALINDTTGHDFYGDWLAGTPVAVSLVIASAVDEVTFTMPAVQIREISEGDRDGTAIENLVGQCNHSTGDDAVTITAAAS